MMRTASMGSRVPPAVTSTRTPGEVVALGEHRGRGLDDDGRVGEAALPDVTAGEAPALGIDHVHAAAPQRREVVLHRGVLPHLGVHRRRHQHRRARREQRGGEQVVGDAGRVLAERLGGARRDHDEIGGLAEARVRDRLGTVEQRRARGLRRRARRT